MVDIEKVSIVVVKNEAMIAEALRIFHLSV